MRIHLLERELWLPRGREEVFAFFADPTNLQVLTPPWLHFRLTTRQPIKLEPGARINYNLKLHSFTIRWESEITVWEPPHRFVDEQRRGPYDLWVHEHAFAETDGGTTVSDRVRYAVFGGALSNRLFVARDLDRIFRYRREKLLEIFGATNGGKDKAIP